MSPQEPHDLRQQQPIPNHKKNKTALGMLHSSQSGSKKLWKA
jgi:hypothetical protein